MEFEEPTKLLFGLVTGIVFGFLLQKGQVAKFRVIVDQLLLRDWTVVKIMLTAIAVGTIGVHFLVEYDVASLHVKEALWGRILPGAVLFGIGMAVLGLCPGTCVAACGEGARDAYAGALGMLVSGFFYVALFPHFQGLFEAWGNSGKLTFPGFLGLPALGFAVAASLAIGIILHFMPSDKSSRNYTKEK